MTKSYNHPKGLMALFFTEMWERFSYYGMRALLVLYLTSTLISGGMGMGRSNALEIYAVFTGLVYLTPLLGGLLADKYLGQRKSILIGALLMAAGQFTLAYSQVAANLPERENLLYYGLGFLIMGNGFFKPNISTIVGQLYQENDPRRDSGFTLFYMGINVGAFISPLIAGTLGEKVGWAWGFSCAGVGMLLGLGWFISQASKLGTAGLPPKRVVAKNEKPILKASDWLGIIAITVTTLILVVIFLNTWSLLGKQPRSTITTIATVIGATALLYIILSNTKGKTQWSRVAVIFVLCSFNVFFWAGFEQVGGTLNLFAREKVNLMLGNWEIPVTSFQSIGAIAIVIFAPLFSILWSGLSKIKANPNTPVKFVIGLIFLGLGFVVISLANNLANNGLLISPLWLVAVYLLHTFGELSLSPIGLSMITKLSPPKITSIMMGVWFGSTALANYFAGMLETILQRHLPGMHLFNFLVITSFSAAFVLFIISPILKKMMKGIH
ncbi:MAG: peptide MFS transporter [Prolixibacteraceae bacterium]|nr:peptide MFS transporter [Prolixibacteraceae bacterium]